MHSLSDSGVTDREQVRSPVARIEKELGPVEVLGTDVRRRGSVPSRSTARARSAAWAQCGGMLERGRGHIVTISSDAGRKVLPGLAVYSASKFFVEALSQGLRLETAGTGSKGTTRQRGGGPHPMSGDEKALEEYGQPGESRVLDSEEVAASVM